MRRKLVWVERQTFHGWACSACAWTFNPLGPPVGESIDEMKMHYERQRDKEFTSHVCAEHPGSRKKSPLAKLPALLQRGATMESPFDILKKIDAVNFEWVEAVRDLQTAEARIQELQARSPGEYVVFSQRTQQIVGRFNLPRS